MLCRSASKVLAIPQRMPPVLCTITHALFVFQFRYNIPLSRIGCLKTLDLDFIKRGLPPPFHQTRSIRPMADELGDRSPNLSTPPCNVELRVSPSTCSISGAIPFKVIKSYTCTSIRPTWFLFTLYSEWAHELVVRDPNHPKGKYHRVGPFFTWSQDEWDQEEIDIQDTELVRLEPGEKFETEYVFRIKPRPLSTETSDVKNMKADRPYWIEVGHAKCWWICADDLKENLTSEEMRDLLGQRKYVQWKPTCRVDFETVS
jgi:hypothetical protein